MERIPLISFVGPEGSGKSTQARLLAKQLGLTYVSTGDMIRDAIANDQTELGDACRKMSAKACYLEAHHLLTMVTKRLRKDDVANGVVLDGGFRTLEETENFPQALEEIGKSFDLKVIFLRLPLWESIQRLIENKRGRVDDTPEKGLSRIVEFNKDLGKRMSFLRNTWGMTMIFVKGMSAEEVNEKVREKLIAS